MAVSLPGFEEAVRRVLAEEFADEVRSCHRPDCEVCRRVRASLDLNGFGWLLNNDEAPAVRARAK